MNHIYHMMFNTTAQTQQTANKITNPQEQSISPNNMACLALAISLSLVSPHALAGGGKSGGSASIAAAGGTDVLSGPGGAGVSGGTYGGGGGGAGTTGGQGGTGSGGAGIAGAGGTFAAGGNGNGGNGGFSGNGGGGGGGGAHGFVGTALPISAKTGGNGGSGGNGSLTSGGGGAGGYGAVITSAVSSGSIAQDISGGAGGGAGAGALLGGDGGSGGHGLVLQYGGTLSINSRISGGAGGNGYNRGNGGDGGDGIHVHTAGSSLNLTLENGANIQAGNGGASGGGASTAGTAGAAIRFNSGSNSLTLHDTVQIHGNVVATSGSNDTLNVRGKGITAGNIQGFEKLHFYVQSDTPANATLLRLTESTDISSSTIGVGLEGSNTLLNEGDSINLITTSGTLTTPTTLNNNTTGMSGISTLYDFTLQANSQTLTATVTKVGINLQTKSLSEARLSGVSFVNRGADLASEDGINKLEQATQTQGINSFMALGGGKYRTATGSHIDVKGSNLLIGAGTSLANSAGKLTLGAYAEYGNGSYNSFNDFSNRPDVHANGDTHYYGLGIMAKQALNNGFFVEGGIRAGKSKMDYHSNDLVDAAGNATRFSGKSNYRGLDIGAGYTFAINNKSSLSPYAKIHCLHNGKINRTIAGDTFDFNQTDSLRSQLGAKLPYQINPKSQIYANLAWEREYKGTAKAQVLGLSVPEPSLKGNTGIVGAGMQFTPHKNISLEFGVNGSFGKRRGVGLGGKFRYMF